MEKQGRSEILFRCFKEHTTLKSTFQIKASPGRLRLAALVFATLVGLVAGILPANKAVKISSLEAIRHD